MEWAGAWKIANVTATFIITVGLRRLKKYKQQKALHVCFANSLPQAVAMAAELVEGEKFKYHVCSFFVVLSLPPPPPPQHFYYYLIPRGRFLFATACLETNSQKYPFSSASH